jgi:hypothetical protein
MLSRPRVRSALCTLAFGVFLLQGCKKEEEAPEVVPVPSAPAPVKAAEEAPAQPAQPAAEGSGAAAGTAAPTQQATPTPTSTEAPKPVPQASIDGCCSALSGMAKSGLPADVKAKAAAAAGMCSAVAKSVKEGKASRTTALAQIGATMGGKSPAECK